MVDFIKTDLPMKKVALFSSGAGFSVIKHLPGLLHPVIDLSHNRLQLLALWTPPGT